jgi:hypothetical protein
MLGHCTGTLELIQGSALSFLTMDRRRGIRQGLTKIGGYVGLGVVDMANTGLASGEMSHLYGTKAGDVALHFIRTLIDMRGKLEHGSRSDSRLVDHY